jgi:hypothetical protein
MSGLFGPKPPQVIPPVNPSDTQNRVNQALVDQLQSGGSNADNVAGARLGAMSQVGTQRQSVLTGIA